MRQYKGYYIDETIFNTKEDIDRFLEEQAVNAYKTACKLFAETRSMSASMTMDEKAEYLVNQFGYTWEQLEAIEISVLKAIA